jgi:hypothetical protein
LLIVAESVLAEPAFGRTSTIVCSDSVSEVLRICSHMEEATIPRLLRFVIARRFLQLTARVRSNKGRALVLFASKDLTCAFVTPTAKW